MAGLQKGKSFLFCLSFFVSCSLLFLSPIVTASESDPPPYEHSDASHGVVTVSESDRQGVALHRLEELVRNLTEVVARLDAKLSETSSKEENEMSSNGVKEKAKKAFSVTKYSPFWSERFEFTSAVKLNSEATCINVLPFKDHEGLSKYFAVGDSSGNLYVFLRNGDVLVEFFSNCDSPITAMVSYLSVYKNESFVVTGHQSGAVLLHRLREGSMGDDLSSAVMESVGKFDVTEDGLEVTLLEVHHVGRVRYILATDLTAWGPDDPFTSSSSSASFSEPSRRNNDDLMDLRRRYVSPSRYPPGAAAGTTGQLPLMTRPREVRLIVQTIEQQGRR